MGVEKYPERRYLLLDSAFLPFAANKKLKRAQQNAVIDLTAATSDAFSRPRKPIWRRRRGKKSQRCSLSEKFSRRRFKDSGILKKKKKKNRYWKCSFISEQIMVVTIHNNPITVWGLKKTESD